MKDLLRDVREQYDAAAATVAEPMFDEREGARALIQATLAQAVATMALIELFMDEGVIVRRRDWTGGAM